MTVNCLAGIVTLAVVFAAGLLALTINDARRAARKPASAETLYAGKEPLVAHARHLSAQPTSVQRAPGGEIVLRHDFPNTAPATIGRPEAVMLAAEALVVEEALGLKPSQAMMHYLDHDLALPLTPPLQDLALRRLDEIRAAEEGGPRLRRQDPAVCRACAYRAMCPIGRVNAPAPHSALG